MRPADGRLESGVLPLLRPPALLGAPSSPGERRLGSRACAVEMVSESFCRLRSREEPTPVPLFAGALTVPSELDRDGDCDREPTAPALPLPVLPPPPRIGILRLLRKPTRPLVAPASPPKAGALMPPTVPELGACFAAAAGAALPALPPPEFAAPALRALVLPEPTGVVAAAGEGLYESLARVGFATTESAPAPPVVTGAADLCDTRGDAEVVRDVSAPCWDRRASGGGGGS